MIASSTANIGRRTAVLGLAVAVIVPTAIANPVPVLAALLTGVLNTAAGGGAIVTFLALTAVGVAPLTAHATSQLVTPSSFLGAAHLVRDHWPGVRPLITAGLGTLAGVGLLKITPASTFTAAAPFVLVPAALLVLVQEPVKRRIRRTGRTIGPRVILAATFACGVYAGLVGVGTGTLALVVLGLTPALSGATLRDLLCRRNALLLVMALLGAAAFAATGLADWGLAAQLVLPGIVGGWLGTRLVGRLPVPVLQAGVVLTAVAGAVWMALR